MKKHVINAFKGYVGRFGLTKKFKKLVAEELHIPYQLYLEYVESIYAIRRLADYYDESSYAKLATAWEEYVVINGYSGRISFYTGKYGLQKTLTVIKELQRQGKWAVPKGYRDNKGLLLYLETHKELYSIVDPKWLPENKKKITEPFDVPAIQGNGNTGVPPVPIPKEVECDYIPECLRPSPKKTPDEYVIPVKAEDSNEDYCFYDFSLQKGKKGSKPDLYIRIPKKTAKTYVISICSKVYEEIDKNGLYMLRIRVDNLTNDIHLVFNKEKGVEVNHYQKAHTRVCNKDMALFLRDKLNLSANETVVALSKNLANSDKYATYKLIKR